MKPEELTVKEEESESPTISGDAIGDTAYSERFVLKILLKLANLDTLKDEIQEKSFEDDLCTLWDMTAERDVVLFLQKHNVLNLFMFALPGIESQRIVEIIVGIVGNMCCQKEAVTVLLKMDSFLTFILEYMKSDDSLLLVQVLRLVSSSLFVADDEDIGIWMDLFIKTEFSTALYFILNNSSNKDLLNTALENFNTLCSYCNTEKYRSIFFTHFITKDALVSLSTAFSEIWTNQKDSYDTEEFERILVICLQICLNLVGFDKSLEIYSNCKDYVVIMISQILTYYENKLINQKEIDSDLVDIIDSTNTIVGVLQLNESCELDTYFRQSYSMWKALCSITMSNRKSSDFEEGDKKELQDISNKMKTPLCNLICAYMKRCSDTNLLQVLDEIGINYDSIVGSLEDKEMQDFITARAANYRTRLKDNVDS